jgi:Zn-dependent metalloprotease/DNA-binding beta-propeller fold protein YncE
MKTHFRKIYSGILIALYISSMALPGAVLATPQQSGIEQVPAAKHEPKRGINPETGKVSFIGAGDPMIVPGIMSLDGSQDRAMIVASAYGKEFGLKNPKKELRLVKSNKDGNGNDLVHYQQMYEGVPVFASTMIVNINAKGELLSISGEVASDLALDTKPAIKAQDALKTALKEIAELYKVDEKELSSTNPELFIFDESILTASTRPAELVWRMEVTAKDTLQPIREMILINAQTGEISFHINQVDMEEHAHSETAGPVSESRQLLPATVASQIPYTDLLIDEARGKLYGADIAGNKIDVINMNDLSVSNSYILGYGALPTGIDLSPDGSELAVAQSGLNRVKFINLIDGTLSESSAALSGSNTKATDVLYGRPGILYALSNNGIHVINTNAVPHAENTTQYLSVDGSSNGQKFGELSSDQKTLYYVTGIPSTASNILVKMDVSEGLTKPTILKKASLYQTSMMMNLRLSLIDDGTLLISTGIVYNTADLTPKARNGQTLSSVTAIPTRDFYVTAYDNSLEIDNLYFFDKDSSYKISMLDTVSGVPGAMAATSDGSRLFISSTGGMTAVELGVTPPGTQVPLPNSLKQYRDFVFDIVRNRVYGTDASNRIDVIDQDTGSVLNSYLLPNGTNPIGIDLSPDGNELAVALNGLEKILFINPESGVKIAEVTPNAAASSYYVNLPYDVIYGRPGRLYAAGHPSSYGSDYLHIIDTVSHTWLARSASYLDISDDLAISPDKKFLYANEFSSSYNLHTFNIQTDTVTEVSEAAISAEKFAVAHNESKIFTLAGSVWDMNTKEKLGTLEGAPGNLIEYILGQNAVVLAAQDGNSSVLKFISDTNYRVLTTYRPESTGTILEMEMAPDGNTLIASFSDGNLLLLDISTILPVPPSPPPTHFTTQYSDLVIDESRGKLYGADQVGHKIDVINMSDMQVVQAYFLVYGSSPTGVDLSPDGNVLAVAQSGLRRVAFINLTDGTISALPAPLSGSSIRATDVLYGRPGILYALSNNGLHVIDTSVTPPVEITTQYVSLSSSLERFGALSADKNTLYYVTSASSGYSNLAKFNVSAGLIKPVKLTETYLNESQGLRNIRLSLIDDNTLLTSFGTVYRTLDLQPKAKNGQILAPVTALPGRNFYVTIYDSQSESDELNFFDLQSSYKVSTLSTNISGIPGSVAVTSDGNTLFVSSTGGMAKFAIGATPHGTPVDLPQSLRQYRDLVFDLPRGVIYGTDASNRIDVIERSTGNLLNSYLLTNGSEPIGIDLSPDGTELAVALNGLEAILFLDPSTGSEIARVTPQLTKSPSYANRPYDVIYGRSGRLYSDGNRGTDRIHAFDTTTHTWLAKSAVPNDTGAELALTADKKYLYAKDGYDPNNISGFDVQTDQLNQVFRTPHGPALAKKIAMTPDGTRIFTSDGQVWSRDLKDQIGTLEGAPGELIKYIPGKNLVALTVGNTIKFISPINYELISTYVLSDPGTLQEMEISPDGVWMILNFSGGGIQILEITSILTENPPIPLPSAVKYEELVIDEPRGKLYGADKTANKVDVIDMSTLSVVSSFSLAYGALPTGIHLSPDGNTLAVAQSGFNRVLFINLTDGTMIESPALQNSRYATTKVYDVLYGRPGLLYALTTSGLHVLNTSLNPPAEDETQFVVFDEDSAKFGAISSDKNTLFVGEDDNSTGHDYVHQFNISAGLAKPVEITYTSFYNPYMTQLSLADDNILVTSWGSTYDASVLMLKAKDGQSAMPVMTIPGRNFYAVAYNNPNTSSDGLYFFDEQSSHKLSSLSTNKLGSPGAMAITSDGNTLFVSSSGGMTKHEIEATPPGTEISLPQRVGEYRDFAFDLPRGVIYGTDASGRVDVLDQDTGDVIRSYLLSNGANPKGIDLSPDGRELAVALGGLEAILFINPETGTEIARVTPKLVFTTYYFNWPYDVIYGRDGRLYSDGNTGSNGANDYIHIYDTTTHTWLSKANYLVRNGSELALTADKKYLYVADSYFSTNNFSVFDVQTDTPTRLYAGTANSQKFTIAPDGSKLFYSSGQVWSGNLQQQIGTLPGSGTFVDFVPGQNALAQTVGNALKFVSASDYQLLSTYDTPYIGNALEMEVAPDGSKLIANYSGGIVGVFDLSIFPPPTPIPTSTATPVPSSTPGPGPSPTPRSSATPGPSQTSVPPSSTGNRRTYSAGGSGSLPGTFLCDQSQSSCTNGADLDADEAHRYAADTFVFYNTHHQRNGIDNAGSTILSTVNYGVNYQNAFWNGSQVVYGDNMAADDVVGHEITHGVTEYTSDLIYYGQSGAINESFSDVWGEFIDQTNGSGNDSPSVKWLIGEDTLLGAIRSMSDPTMFGDPDKMTSPYYYTGPGDNGGVHFNSGVNNKAVYLMVEGGTFNGRNIIGIGLDKTAAVYYEAQIHHLTMGTNYNDLYYALLQACQNLNGGAAGITQTDCEQVRLAAEAVEMIPAPIPTPTPTNTFIPTVTPPYSYNPLYLSLTGSQTIGGVASADEDILRFDGQNWSLFFDGSDVGVGSPDLSAFSIVNANMVLMSFSANVTVNGVTATPQDVLRFDATTLGSATIGTFSIYFDGSDVGFADATNEKIDSLKLLPDGRLLISATGNPSVPGATTARDEDILAFTPTSLGDATAGTWLMYFDGSDVGLSETSGEDIDALDVVGNNIYLSTQDLFSVNGVSGEDDDVVVCGAASTGEVTGCNYSSKLYFDGSTWGLTANDIDGFNFLAPGSFPTAVPTNTATRTPTTTSTVGTPPTHTSTATLSPTPTSGSESTLMFTAVADARISQASPTTNYGTATTLQVDGDSGAAQPSYIRFNASGLTGSILSAKLRVFCTTNGTVNGPAAYLANSSWTESGTGGINWNNQPTLESGAFDNKGSIAANSWVEYDVTALVTGNGMYTFALVADSSDGIVFSSREGTTPPQLVVTFGGEPSTSTPTSTNPPSMTDTPTATPSPTDVASTPTFTATATPTLVSSHTPTATPTTGASLFNFTSIADAYVDANNPANNYGALTTLRVDASPIIRSYLRFDVQGLSGSVTKATLRVFANSASSQGCTASSVSGNTWTESTLNYNNAPTLGGTLGSSGSFGASAWISIDVTAYITGNGTYNLALTTPSSTAVSLASRETSANAPQLIIETTP